ncbi:TetR/AcrR family transcriptional regulator [Mycoplasmatota bacterium]|nr:TetR/AcrR family transcriptional regulator [Mycoplasmatota bacterium]
MSRERQLKKQEEIRNKILNIAKKIITEKGVEHLSIRKITNELDYSPGIIYHYFKDKNEIIETLAKDGYMKILSAISKTKRDVNDPLMEIKSIFQAYINAVLDYPEEYKAFMLSNDPNIIEKTTVLEKGISKRSKTMSLLTEIIQRGIDEGQFQDNDAELTAQIVWSSAFGLVIRLIIENKIGNDQKEKLIQKHFEILFNGLLKKEGGSV